MVAGHRHPANNYCVSYRKIPISIRSLIRRVAQLANSGVPGARMVPAIGVLLGNLVGYFVELDFNDDCVTNGP